MRAAPRFVRALPIVIEAWFAFESQLDDRAMWICDYIGRYERPRLQTATLAAWDEIVLASDGARLNLERVARFKTRCRS